MNDDSRVINELLVKLITKLIPPKGYRERRSNKLQLGFTMERKRRRLLIQAIFVCVFLIYGVNSECQKDDDCENNGKCQKKKCVCEKYYFGDNCEKHCDTDCLKDDNLVCSIAKPTKCSCKNDDYFQNNPSDITKGCTLKTCKINDDCLNGGKCDTIDWKCECDDKYFGGKCEKECDKVCLKKDNLKCQVVDGYNECVCVSRNFVELDSANILQGCRSQDCTKEPYCKNEGTCDSANKCICPDGYFGKLCEGNCDKECNSADFLACVDDPKNPPFKICQCIDNNHLPNDVKNISKGCYSKDDCTKFPPSANCLNSGVCNDVTKKCDCVENQFFGWNCRVPCQTMCPKKNTKCRAADEITISCVCIDDEHKPDGGIENGCYKDPCTDKVCSNGGTCIEDGITKTASCSCAKNFFGDTCQFNCTDTCKPGLNLTCIENKTEPKWFSCECSDKDKFIVSEGTDILKEGCRESKCYNFKCGNGKCLDQHPNEPICNCTKNYFGSKCADECETMCPSKLNLICKADSDRPTAENKFDCDCVNSTYEKINDTEIKQGCQKTLCVGSFCKNGGTCQEAVDDTNGRYEVCICPEGFYGPKCDRECDAFCNETIYLKCVKDDNSPLTENDAKCECVENFRPIDSTNLKEKGCIEDLCGKLTDKNPCFNNATCEDSVGTVVCSCPNNIFGQHCEIKCEDKCKSGLNLICKADTPQTPLNDFKCACADSHIQNNITLDNIEVYGCRKNICTIDRGCENGGECNQTEGTCKCHDKFFGSRCEILCSKKCSDVVHLTCEKNKDEPQNIDLATCKCKSDDYIFIENKNPSKGCFKDMCKDQTIPCSGNGKCTPKPGEVNCNCNTGFFGRECELSCHDDKCNKQPNTTCTEAKPPNNDVDCKCEYGYKSIGAKPEDKGCRKDVCGNLANQVCNFGKCVDDDSEKYKCECNTDYFGPHCLTHCSEICNKQPNTICTINGDCECKSGYVENEPNITFAGCRKEYCTNDFCDNNGTCTDYDGVAKCLCKDGYFGQKCSDHCSKLCPGPNLKCVKDISKPYADNAANCVCKGYTYTEINKADIANEGCKIDTCLGNTCDSKGTKYCHIVNDNDYRCICKENYFGKNCEEICGEVCNKPNLRCELANKDDITNNYKCVCESSDYKEIVPNDAESNGCSKRCMKDENCYPNATCSISDGSCKCDQSFILSGDICIPEMCPCEFGGECIPVGDDYKCKCLEGFAGTKCQTRCDDECGSNAKCEGEDNKISCSCHHTYVNASTTNDLVCVLDVCNQSSPCENNGKCDMLATGHYSCRCESEEYIGKNCSIKCEDVCGRNAKCEHHISSNWTKCSCADGFKNVGNRLPVLDCVKDFCKSDTCKNGGVCQMKAENLTECNCTNEFIGANCECKSDVCVEKCPGADVECISGCNTFACKCKKSTQYWNGNACVDFDECEFITCDPLKECKNGICQCKPGHRPDGDKCEEMFKLCTPNLCSDPNSVCVDDEPSYLCACNNGYYRDPLTNKCEPFSCEDICPFGQNCDHNKNCLCPTNFKNDNGTCVPSTECQDPDKYGNLKICYVADGEDKFICKSGYKDVSSRCLDINECQNVDIKKSCDPYGECENLPGSYICNCGLNAYSEDYKTCLPINECTSKSKPHYCDLQSTKCIDDVQGFRCRCKEKYEQINATHCKPQDKCKGNNPCTTSRAQCQNNVFSKEGYDCICPLAEIYDSLKGCIKANQLYPGEIQLYGTFTSELKNSSSQLYLQKKTEIETALEESLKTPEDTPVAVKVTGFRDGSIVADYILLSPVSLTNKDVAEILTEQCRNLTDGTTCVLGASTKIRVITDNIYKSDKFVENKCPSALESICTAGFKCFLNTNSITPFECRCPDGFREKYFDGSFAACEDINECEENSHKCEKSQECENTRGGYKCHCKSEYFKLDDGSCKKTCEDNPCEKGTCVVETNFWRCDCETGYSGKKCEVQHEQYKAAVLGWEVAVGVLAAAFAVCLIVSCMIIRKLKKKVKKNLLQQDNEFNDYSSQGQSTNNLAPTKNDRRMNDYDNPAGP